MSDTTINLEDTVPLVRITRQFDAPPAKVCRAHVEPDLVVRCLGPSRLEMHIERWDGSTGGAYRYRHAGDDGTEHWFHGSFHEVHPNEAIIQTFTYEGTPGHVALERAAFEAVGDGRTRLVATSLVESFEARDAFVASGMEEGVIEGYERLDALLAR